MTVTTNWNDLHAHEASIDWSYPLMERGADYNKPGEYAITIAGDDVFAVYGKPDDLIEFARQVTVSARQIHTASLGPGHVQDFRPDEDGSFQCPRCEEGLFDPHSFDNFGELADAIAQHVVDQHPGVG